MEVEGFLVTQYSLDKEGKFAKVHVKIFGNVCVSTVEDKKTFSFSVLQNSNNNFNDIQKPKVAH